MITVVCVLHDRKKNDLKSFPVSSVNKLKRMVDKCLDLPHQFVCLTNLSVISGIDIIPLKNDWKGWWSKIEIFRPNLFSGRILYFDLDTVILNDITDMVHHEKDFIGLRPFHSGRAACPGYVASGIMSWNTDGTFDFLYEEFNYQLHTNVYKGDQDYISMALRQHGITPSYWQDIVPGIYSYKQHIRRDKRLLKGAKVVCFHGLPRPHQLREGWVIRAWRN